MTLGLFLLVAHARISRHQDDDIMRADREDKFSQVSVSASGGGLLVNRNAALLETAPGDEVSAVVDSKRESHQAGGLDVKAEIAKFEAEEHAFWDGHVIRTFDNGAGHYEVDLAKYAAMNPDTTDAGELQTQFSLLPLADMKCEKQSEYHICYEGKCCKHSGAGDGYECSDVPCAREFSGVGDHVRYRNGAKERWSYGRTKSLDPLTAGAGDNAGHWKIVEPVQMIGDTAFAVGDVVRYRNDAGDQWARGTVKTLHPLTAGAGENAGEWKHIERRVLAEGWTEHTEASSEGRKYWWNEDAPKKIRWEFPEAWA